jgi:glycosyltransferase involved in cell wall biosynthesis
MLSVIVTYYNQPQMLAVQCEAMAGYPPDVELIVVDDGSEHQAIDVPRPAGVSVYRVKKDIPWHQDGARNLGAHVATGEWLLLLDIDHVLPATEVSNLLDRLPSLPAGAAFRPARRLVDDAYPLERAANIWLMRTSDYWRVGGYDERLCGHYGTDLEYRPRLRRTLKEVNLSVTVDVYRDVNVSGASTRGLSRQVRVPRRVKGPPVTLSFEWERQ